MLVLKSCIWCNLLYNFPFSKDYSFLLEILYFELSGKAEVNYMDALFFSLLNFFMGIPWCTSTVIFLQKKKTKKQKKKTFIFESLRF